MLSQSTRNLLLLGLILILPAAAWAVTSDAVASDEAVTERLNAEALSTNTVNQEASTSPHVGPTGSAEVAGVCKAANALPTTVIQDMSAGFSCPSYFWTASSCNACWAAYGQCVNNGDLPSYGCYGCTELCLGRVGCFIP